MKSTIFSLLLISNFAHAGDCWISAIQLGVPGEGEPAYLYQAVAADGTNIGDAKSDMNFAIQEIVYRSEGVCTNTGRCLMSCVGEELRTAFPIKVVRGTTESRVQGIYTDLNDQLLVLNHSKEIGLCK